MHITYKKWHTSIFLQHVDGMQDLEWHTILWSWEHNGQIIFHVQSDVHGAFVCEHYNTSTIQTSILYIPKGSRSLMREIKDSLTELELSCVTHVKQWNSPSDLNASQSSLPQCERERQRVINHPGTPVTLLHNPFLSLSPLHIWALPNWFYLGQVAAGRSIRLTIMSPKREGLRLCPRSPARWCRMTDGAHLLWRVRAAPRSTRNAANMWRGLIMALQRRGVANRETFILLCGSVRAAASLSPAV